MSVVVSNTRYPVLISWLPNSFLFNVIWFHAIVDTGYRPYVCKNCGRPFARQDSLIRHNRLNSCLRRESQQSVSSRSDVIIQPPPYTTPPGAYGVVVPTSNAREENSAACSSSIGQTWAEQEPTPSPSSGSHNSPPVPPEIDFDLIWPDSEDLIQSILSSDSINQWQVPLATLPAPPALPQARDNNYGATNSFLDKVSSICPIPSGESHLAVHNVSRMVTNLVSYLAETSSDSRMYR